MKNFWSYMKAFWMGGVQGLIETVIVAIPISIIFCALAAKFTKEES